MPRPEHTGIEAAETEPNEGAVRGIVGYNLKRAYMVLHTVAQDTMAEFGLRIPSFTCLSVIVQNPGIAPSVLAEQLKIERSNVVVIVDELERNDLVSRKQMKTDRRRYELTATIRGRRVHDQTVAAVLEAEGRRLKTLSIEEQALLIDMLNRIETSTGN